MNIASRARPLGTQPDQRLVALVRDGHERAFEVLVQRHRRALVRYCGRFSLADARAEDVLQQAFLSAWIAMRAGAEVREVKPWLFRIVHNAALNSLRAERSQGQAASIDTAQAASVELTALPGFAGRAGVEDVLLARDLLAGMAELPEMQREVLLRAALRGDSYEQVAGALGISDGAVRGLLHRARATLRASVPGFAPPPLVAWAARGLRRAGTASVHVGEIATNGGGGLAARSGVAALAAGIAIAGAAFGPGQHARPASQAPPAAATRAGDARSPSAFAPSAGREHLAPAGATKHSTRAATAARAAAGSRARSSANATADAHTGTPAAGSTSALGQVAPPTRGEGAPRSGEASTNGRSSAQQASSGASTSPSDVPSAGHEASTGAAQSTASEASTGAHSGQAATSAPAQETAAAASPAPLAAAEVTTSSGTVEAKVVTPVASVEASVTQSTGTISVAVTPVGTPEGTEAPVAVSVGSGGVTVKVGAVKLAVGSSSGTSSGGLVGSLLGGL